MKNVYLDNAATTPMAKEVIDCMTAVMQDDFGNPSSTHAYGRKAKALLENSRRTVARLLHCEPSEIIFTSGGTEADNMAINSSVHLLGVTRVITTPIEHHAVGHTVEALEKEGKAEMVFVKTDDCGTVDLQHLEELLADTSKKTLVSLMHANNEIGILLPLKRVSDLCRKYNAFFHSDTVQTMGHYAFDLKELDIDFITCAAHKFHGPKGVGFLYCSKKVKVENLIHGGSQERGLRGGTENLYGIVGLAKAMELAYEDVESHQRHVQELKSYMIERLKEQLPDVGFHGSIAPEASLYTVLNVKLPATEKSGMLLFTLDLKGVAASGGSACTSGANKGSHVLTGIDADLSRPNVRFSFSRYTTKEEIDYAVGVIAEVYEKTLV
ncbi:cysteine desulfurase [Crocinitomicaceae bacterium CZZ-1]|uniref:cysteine desulfurase n=1 Tax=Taishania pollutisoli TaxID=2766479 RepID=A0A8J6P9K9_9FLAO|nr:cysteine desulfurase family protein [Taishania pollutisoli]MBC9811113.1 cysteine desulfurase [Taishania pollutisoli]